MLCFWSQAADPALAVPRSGSEVAPGGAGTDLEHLPDLPAGQADVQLVHQLVDLLDVQQPVPVLVSLLEGLLHPAASVSRTGTQGFSPRTSSGKNPLAPALSTAQPNA